VKKLLFLAYVLLAMAVFLVLSHVSASSLVAAVGSSAALYTGWKVSSTGRRH